MNAHLTRRIPLLLLVLALALLLASEAASAAPADATASAKKTKVCKQRKGESKKKWQKRCGCKKPRRGETRRRFRKRCVAYRKPAAQTPVAQAPAPAPAPPPVLEPVRNDAGFGAILARSYFLRTYKPSSTATHSEYYAFCGPRIEPHHYEGIAYIYEARGPWRVIEGFVNGDGSKGHGEIEFIQEQANFDEERGKVQRIKISWPAEGRSDVALISHPEIGAYFFARTLRDC